MKTQLVKRHVRQFTCGILLAGAVVAVTCVVAYGQARDRSVLSGTVVDQMGGALREVDIVVTSEETGAVRRITTDDSGFFAVPALVPGRYSLSAKLDRFALIQIPSLIVNPDTPLNLRITLKLGNTAESVTVTADSVTTVNTVDATRGNALQEREVKNLPFLARNPIGLLTLQPGVVFTGQSDPDNLFQGSTRALDQRDGVVNGVRGNQTNVQVDGADTNDFETQAAFTSVLPVTLDSVQEFRVVTTNANATDGVASGAQIQLITKSGSNAFHGNLREYNRNTALAANSFFSNRSGLVKPKLNRNVYGGSLGGRIIPKRAFFFFDYEGRRDATESPQVRTGPSETLKQGVLTYRTTNGRIATLNPADIRALDPAGLGVNPNGVQYLSLYPKGNDPAAGPDGGLNFNAFRFNAPLQTDNKIYTGRLDFNLTEDGRHMVFVRGILADLRPTIQAAQYPELPAKSLLLNNSRGLLVNYTAQIAPAFLSTLRYGLTRQGLQNNGAPGPFLASTTIGSYYIGGDNYSGTARANGRRVPVHEANDDLTLVRGKHTLQFGTAVRIVRDRSFSEGQSYPNFYSWPTALRASPDDPYTRLLATGDPNMIPADSFGFTQAFMALTGSVNYAQATFQTDPKTKRLLPFGIPRVREFAENGIELYVQDTWRLRPHVTITAGLRYSRYSPIWETNGAMVRPTIDVRDWWNRRQADMNAGIPSDASPLISYDLAGRANGRPSWYSPDNNNFAPRVAIAYNPHFDAGIARKLFGAPGKSSIRAGFGVYFDRLGGALAVATDRFGSPGSATTLSSSQTLFDLATAPRLSAASSALGPGGLPDLSAFLTPPDSGSFPYTYAGGATASGFMVDNRLSTPYSMHAALSFQRELGHQLVLDVGYVGTFNRQQLGYVNLAQYYGDFKDPASGQTLWGAYNQIVDLIGSNPASAAINPGDPAALARIAPIAFIENLLPNLPALTRNPTLSPTQAFYALAARANGDWRQPLRTVDTGLTAGNSPWNQSVDPQRNGYVLFQPQFSSLSAWLNSGSSSYHSLQITARRSVGRAMFAMNYVLSRSADNGSAPENNDLVFGAAGADQIQNAFRTKAGYALSNFDLRHNFNAHALADLPFGRGQRFGRNSSQLVNQLIGGWTVATVWRWRSGFPLSIGNGNAYPTNPLNQGPATVVSALQTEITRNGLYGLPNLFPDPVTALGGVQYTRPGEVGSRNVIRGPGAFLCDLAVHKRFTLPWSDHHRLELRGSAFNAFNTVNFATAFFNTNLRLDRPTSFGNLSSTSGPRGGSREIELAVRYEF